ncbi:hypothetical protein ACFL7D_09575, partial [candidate division KSB1 bacterium]
DELNFRNRKSIYFPDYSSIWASNISHNEPLEMAEALFNYIEKLSEEKSINLLMRLLDIFRDNVWVTYFWSRLLKTASNIPEILAKELYDLCISPLVLTGLDTMYSVGLLLEKGFEFFDSDQKKKIEETILNLTENIEDDTKRESFERARNQLLGCINTRFIETDEAQQLVESLSQKNDIPENKPPIEFEASWGASGTEQWLEIEGADLTKPKTDDILQLLKPLEEFGTKWLNKNPDQESIEKILPIVKKLYAKLLTELDLDQKVISYSWSTLASAVERISYGIVDVESDTFTTCRAILLKSAYSDCPESDPEKDAKYDFGSHSREPRNEAAIGLPVIYAHKPDEGVLSVIESLASDKVPSVRMLVAMNLWRIYGNSPEEFWKIANNFAESESNFVVLNWFSNTIGRFVLQEEKKTVDIFKKYIDKAISKKSDYKSSRPTIGLLTYLSVIDNPWAVNKLEEITKKSLENSDIISDILFHLIDKYISPKTLASEEQRDFAINAIKIVEEIVNLAVKGIHTIRKENKGKIDEDVWTKLYAIFKIIDQVISRLYFSSVYKPSDKQEKRYDDEQLEIFYSNVKYIFNSIITFALDENNGIMFAPAAHRFMEMLNGLLKYDPKEILKLAAGLAKSSERFQYNLDSLAVIEVVNLVDNIMANHRHIFQEDEESLQNLLDLLDVFARAGWVAARKLLWNLDEIYR